MSSAERSERKAKLMRLASDLRGNEHERRVAELAYRKMCEADGKTVPGSRAGGKPRRKIARHRRAGKGAHPASPARPEFNAVERTIIVLGAVVILGADFLAGLRILRRDRGARAATR